MRSSPAGVVTASGPRAAEERLLAALETDLLELRADLARLARPLYVVVPSESLRLALEERIAARSCGPALGMQVLTLHRFGRLLHERGGVEWPRGEALLAVLARRLAPAHAELAALGESRDGLAALVAALRDLQHAGFTPAHVEALEDCLAEQQGHPALPRVRALIALAAELDRALAAAGCAPAGAWARVSAALLRAQPELAGARAIWIHGFQDAPGTTSELIEVLVTRAGARMVFDTLALALPQGPTGTRYGEALANRLALARPPEREAFAEAGVELRFVNALGLRAEARAVATAVRASLARGSRPERIAIVARSLTGVAGELAASLRALGVPFSGLSAQGSLTPSARAAHALADLVEDGPRVHVVRALRAGWSAPTDLGATEHELLAACGLLGATRLESLADLDLARALDGARFLRLPGGRGRARVERGTEPGEDAEDDLEEEEQPEIEDAPDNRRDVPRAALDWIHAQARSWRDGLAGLPAKGRLAQFAEPFASLVRSQFPSRDETLGEALRALAEALPEGFLLTRAEFLELAAEALRENPRSPLGGAGSGVQLLDALEARSRSFDELFLVDARQGVFPRTVREEPLLPDRLRLRLSDVLPDLPIKTAALAEEEALFAGLVASAPRVGLSWTRADDEGKRHAPSPFLRRVWREREGSELCATKVPLASFAPRREGDPLRVELALTETEELARQARRGRDAFAAALPGVLAAHGRSATEAQALAHTRLAVLAELEPERTRPAYPNAYLGSVGGRIHSGDARAQAPWVSALEALASCPWQMLLGRLLGLAPAVPVRDLGAVLEAAHVGSVVHNVLGRVVDERAAEWPDDTALGEMCAEESRKLVHAEHLAPAGLARLLALRAFGFLEVARRIDSLREGRVLAEVEGELQLPSGRGVRFRADRVEHPLEGGELWIDFKTSRRPLSDAARLETRERHMQQAIREARALQGAAYALAAGSEAIGRYVYLHPRIDDERRLQDASGSEPEIRRLFLEATTRLHAAWDEGAFPPRLVSPTLRNEHPGCAYCDYQAACQRGDSGMRARTVEWLRQDEHAPAQAGFAGALQGLWRLKRPPAGVAP